MNNIYTQTYLETISSFNNIISEQTSQTITTYFFKNKEDKAKISDLKEVTDENRLNLLNEKLKSVDDENKDQFAVTINQYLYFLKDNKWVGKEYKQEELKLLESLSSLMSGQQSAQTKEDKPADKSDDKSDDKVNVKSDTKKEGQNKEQAKEQDTAQKNKVPEDIIKKYLVSDDQKKLASLKQQIELSKLDDKKLDEYEIANKDEYKKILNTIEKQCVYNKTIEDIINSKNIYIFEKDSTDPNNIKIKIYIIQEKQVKQLKDLIIAKRSAEVSNAAVEQFRNGEKIDPKDRNSELQKQIAQSTVFRRTVKKLKLKDEEQEDSFLGIFTKLFELLFGPKKKKYKQYSQQQLMNFARYTKAAIKARSITPGKYIIKFKG